MTKKELWVYIRLTDGIVKRFIASLYILTLKSVFVHERSCVTKTVCEKENVKARAVLCSRKTEMEYFVSLFVGLLAEISLYCER